MQLDHRGAEISGGKRSLLPILLAALTMLLAAGCNFQRAGGMNAEPSLTPSLEGIGRATQAPANSPVSLTATITPLPTHPPPSTSLVTSASPAGTTSATCADQAAFVDDVTFRDNTLILPGAAFVKIWRMRNVGTCTWDSAYAIGFVGGARMEASSPVHLTTTVPPGSSVDLAVDLISPDQPGTYQGFWKLIGKGGSYFGIGSDGDVAFWVKVIVPSLPTKTGVVAPSVTPTASATPRPTPEVVASGFASIAEEMSFDLDVGEFLPESGADVSLLNPAPDSPSLVPGDGARMSRYGPPPDPPSPNRCKALNLTGDPIPLSSLSVQGLVCYQTNEGRTGYFRVKSLDDALGIDFVTWGP